MAGARHRLSGWLQGRGTAPGWALLLLESKSPAGSGNPAPRRCFLGGSLVQQQRKHEGGHNLPSPHMCGVPHGRGHQRQAVWVGRSVTRHGDSSWSLAWAGAAQLQAGCLAQLLGVRRGHRVALLCAKLLREMAAPREDTAAVLHRTVVPASKQCVRFIISPSSPRSTPGWANRPPCPPCSRPRQPLVHASQVPCC